MVIEGNGSDRTCLSSITKLAISIGRDDADGRNATHFSTGGRGSYFGSFFVRSLACGLFVISFIYFSMWDGVMYIQNYGLFYFGTISV